MNEYLSPWYILAETGTRRHVITMHYGNGDKPNGESTKNPQHDWNKPSLILASNSSIVGSMSSHPSGGGFLVRLTFGISQQIIQSQRQQFSA